MTIFDYIENFKNPLPFSDIIIHHSATRDGKKNDWIAIDKYHRSFRINYDIFTPPIDVVGEPNYLLNPKFVEFNGNYYVRENVEDFYKEAEKITGKKYNLNETITENYKGIKIETPWRYVGYNAGIELVNDKLEYQIGRPLDMVGGHTIGMNDKAIGICVVGNFDQIEPNNKYLFALSSICRAYMRRFGIQVQNVNFHRDYANKSCPGLFFNKVKLRDYIENGIHTKRNYPDGNPTT